MAESNIIDLFTQFGPLPPRGGDAGTGTLTRLLQRHGVSGAVTISTRALHYDAATGNAETRDACAAAGGSLLPAAALDPRLADPMKAVEGARVLAVFPATFGWPAEYAPLRLLLQALAARSLPLLWEASRPGDVAGALHVLEAAGYAGPVVLTSVASAELAEALFASRAVPQIHLATHLLHGVGEIARAVAVLGAPRIVFASGAPAHSLGASLALVRSAVITEADRALVLGGNARRILAGGGNA